MTYALGVAMADIGLVAADTRSVTDDGLVTDHDELRFKNPLGGESLVLPTTFRKLRKLSGGWATGAGTYQWVELAFQAIRRHVADDLPGIARSLAEMSERAIPALEAKYSGAGESIRHYSSIVVIHRTRTGFSQCVLNPQGRGATLLGAGGLFPPELPELEGQHLLRTYERGFREHKTLPGLAAGVRRIAELFKQVYALCGPDKTVSDFVEIGATTRDRQGRHRDYHIGATQHDALLGMGDTELRELIQRSELPDGVL